MYTFAEFLEEVIGITWERFDDCYCGRAAEEIWDEYEYYLEHPEDYE